MTRLLAIILALSTRAGAATFDVCFDELLVVKLRVIDSQAAPLACIASAAEHGHVAGALGMALPLLVGVPVAACMIPTRDGATIIAPISPGVGQVWGALAFVDGDGLLGHELAHLTARHNPLTPWIWECEQ